MVFFAHKASFIYSLVNNEISSLKKIKVYSNHTEKSLLTLLCLPIRQIFSNLYEQGNSQLLQRDALPILLNYYNTILES